MSEPSHFFLKKRRVGCNETRGQRLGIMMIIRNITMAMKIIPIPSPNRFGRSMPVIVSSLYVANPIKV